MTTARDFPQPPRVTGIPANDLAAMVEYLWSYYRAGILEGGLIQNTQLAAQLQDQFLRLYNLAQIEDVVADKLAYFTGENDWAITSLTNNARQLIAKTTVAEMLTFLGITLYTDEQVMDTVATMIQDGGGLAWTYDDGANALTGQVGLSSGVSGTLTVTNGGTGLATLTAHAVYAGNGTSAPTALTVGANNTVLRGNTGADPSFGAMVLASADFANQGTTSTVLHGNAAGNPAFSSVVLTTDVSGTLPVANGGTSLTTLTSHAVYVGNGASAPTALAVGATNTLLHGNTGADPSYSAVVPADAPAVMATLRVLCG